MEHEKETMTDLFQSALQQFDYSVGQYDNGRYFIVDNDDIFHDMNEEGVGYADAQEVMERLEDSICGIYSTDLADECETYGIPEKLGISADDLPNDPAGWAKFQQDYGRQIPEFINSHQHEFDVMDLFANHTAEVELDRIADPTLEDANLPEKDSEKEKE